MKLQVLSAAIASVAVGFAIPSFGQSTFTHGESKRCESLSGEAKAQCDREEATKTQGPAVQDSQPAAAGGTKPFTDRDEATKSQDQPASSPSWSSDSPQPSSAPAGAGGAPAGMTPD